MPDIYGRSIGVWSSSRQAWRVVGEEKSNPNDAFNAESDSFGDSTAVRTPGQPTRLCPALIHRH